MNYALLRRMLGTTGPVEDAPTADLAVRNDVAQDDSSAAADHLASIMPDMKSPEEMAQYQQTMGDPQQALVAAELKKRALANFLNRSPAGDDDPKNSWWETSPLNPNAAANAFDQSPYSKEVDKEKALKAAQSKSR